MEIDLKLNIPSLGAINNAETQKDKFDNFMKNYID